MKRFLLFLGMVLAIGTTNAQVITIDPDSSHVEADAMSDHKISFEVTNISTDLLNLNLETTKIILQGGWEYNICYYASEDYPVCLAIGSGNTVENFMLDTIYDPDSISGFPVPTGPNTKRDVAVIDVYFISYEQLGSGEVCFIVYDPADSANTVVEACATAEAKTVHIAENFINDNPISIYPNPAINTLNLNIPNAVEADRLVVFDILGTKVIDAKLNNSSDQSITIDHLDEGSYFFMISNNGQKIHTNRFQKTN